MAAESAAVRGLDGGARLSGGYCAADYTTADYGIADLTRWGAEPAKRELGSSMQRSEFSRDRARVLHSSAFRRLADKTQVISPGQEEFPRTRLTHSLEVAQIAREIGAQLGCDPDITDTAGLAHDLGHPPFGHNGEAALNDVARVIGGFEGNAQTFRILTRLEPKLVVDDQSYGLNLTRASLDATCKYPWQAAAESMKVTVQMRAAEPSQADEQATAEPMQRADEPAKADRQAKADELAKAIVSAEFGVPAKFGVYAEDLTAYRWMREGRPDGGRCLEAQVMDWADDVAYSVHDVEDGVHGGYLTLAGLADAEMQALCQDAASSYSTSDAAELAPVLAELLRLPALRELAAFDGSFAALAAVKRATSELTGRFAGAAVAATRQRFGSAPLSRYDAELVIPEQIGQECALLKAMALRYVMRRDGVQPLLISQRRMLTELVEALCAAGGPGLSLLLAPAWRAAGNEQERLRVVIDQVAQLTDTAAVQWHRRLVDGADKRG